MRLTLRFFMANKKAFDRYASFSPSPVSLKDLLEFGSKTGNEVSSYLFLRHELPVRMANIMMEIRHLPKNLQIMPSVSLVKSWYDQSFEEILDFEDKNEADDKVRSDFSESLQKIKNRHSKVVETMAQGVLELQETYPSYYNFTNVNTNTDAIRYFLDRFLLSRISIRMLISQHVLLYGSQTVDNPHYIGTIDPECDVADVLQTAYGDARFLCEGYYLTAPEMDVTCLNTYDEGKKIQIAFVSSHLLHILIEILKNAMRATVETHSNKDIIPKISVQITKGKEDLTIKISDRGGGFSQDIAKLVFEYMYSTAPRPDYVGEGNAPMAGYGYGLPLSRLYARYFGGDLQLSSVEGYGTDAYIYLKVMSDNASECLPVYNTTASRMYHSDIPVSDWSSNKPWHKSHPRGYTTHAKKS
ncbi:pyruvate dehydrogenase (acetyl-transferring) kinase isozyme 3, mitochondrial-like isoform X2 [Mizuhopecten yessoensis]|uniref:pyruvate dehydrogenase (acetyl-transferring) kinase isozyme 3, mitochondrial-like isoform X2 n=1 Tax=Mizuhopecten yessoensis TaxID=6573 RepID=UPI000B457FAE|nr:pyruvate dehydrogenase (acetyl-transferring) kinase isozyme 3, mitochondrial-like isoform X2 [Mizuhopecten yessoensis]